MNAPAAIVVDAEIHLGSLNGGPAIGSGQLRRSRHKDMARSVSPFFGYVGSCAGAGKSCTGPPSVVFFLTHTRIAPYPLKGRQLIAQELGPQFLREPYS